ncbi:acyl-CoA dehydrogenase [Gordonia hirsuta DSM 44140 = NBRC 16056]|uniref:Acyl-[acyl-carrier-protein] dehydrogenase MbtN n=1 Tax=Gordonia hirsuta DSM 44140 = NBRC 16056 TaxID=1121927 RepID=L7LA47_9ACTN|nr:acyl-CoA dehydrogenase family protein [Gordonia hirsuta]GAC57990.1 acyl-CoA dehydrogenase [Gordonia hirsuta DSM 44140 = NBRC 16056]
MKRNLFEAEHDDYRAAVRQFLAQRVVPDYPEWEQAGVVPRSLFVEAAELGAFAAVPEEFGGAGIRDFRFNAILAEEAAAQAVAPAVLGITLQADVCMPYLLDLTNDEQKARWLPGVASGETVVAIGMTEPGTGSDLSGIATTAVRNGDEYVVNGAKTFITNGINADLIITAVRTGPDPHRGLSLMVIERDMPGFERGRNLDKVGLHAQDTAELSFTDVVVPAANLLGEEGAGFFGLTANLPQERLSVAIAGLAAAVSALDWTIDYVRERKAFGKPIGDFQATRFRLAELVTEVDIVQTFLDRAVEELLADRLTAVDAAKAKLWATELQGRVIDACVQLHGGYGYMLEYPIARAFIDARISRIYGGTSEIMKEIVGRSLKLGG